MSGVVGVLGQPGSGKTFWALRAVSGVKRLLWYDTPDNIARNRAELRPRQNLITNCVHVYSLPELVAFLKRHSGGGFRVVYHPFTPGMDRGAEFVAVCRLVWELRETVFVVDEIWRFCNPGAFPKITVNGVKRSHPMEDLAFAGRHRGVTLVFIAQRPAKVSNDLLGVATSYRLFRITLGADLDAMKAHAGVPADMLEKIRMLPDRQHYVRDDRLQWSLQK